MNGCEDVRMAEENGRGVDSGMGAIRATRREKKARWEGRSGGGGGGG